MGFKDFEGFWRVKSTRENAGCAINSIITFDHTGGQVTVLCAIASFPYGEGTGTYKEGTEGEEGKIEVMLNEKTYVISMTIGTEGKREITFTEKQPGTLTGSWTAEDYVPGSATKPAGK